MCSLMMSVKIDGSSSQKMSFKWVMYCIGFFVLILNQRNEVPKMILRYYIGFENTEDRFNQLVDFLKRTGIHRIVLFSSCFLEESSFLKEEYYKNHAKLLKPYVKKLKDMGILVGINLLNTVGHAFYSESCGFNFRRAVTIDGKPSRGCACMLDKDCLEYAKKVYRYYAELEPWIMFSDDDIRGISLGQIVCLCDEHIKLISEKVGKKLTREEIKECILSEAFETNKVKEAFFEQLKEDINNVLNGVSEATREVYPEAEFGLMTTSYPSITLDRNLKEFFEEYYDKNIRFIRTGMDYYREGEHKEIPLAFSMPAIQRNLIDDNRVVICPEIENDTYGFFYKSNAVTNMQIVWCIVNGFRNMMLNLFDLVDYPAENYEEITEMISENMSFYNKLSELIPENHRSSGVNIYADEKALLKRRATDGNLIFKADWYNWLQLDGIPVGYNKDTTPWNFLVGDDILGATAEKIDSILKKGAVIDLRAAECLLYMGYGDRIGIKSIDEFKEDYAGERFTDNDLNGIYKNRHNSYYMNPNLVGKALKKITFKDRAVKLSYIVNCEREDIGNGVTLYENEAGERFFIIPFDTNVFLQFSNVNNKRKHQLISAFNWIKDSLIYSENENVVINVNETESGRIITLFNLTSDTVKMPRVCYKPERRLKYVAKDGEIKDIDYTVSMDCVEINYPISPLGVLVIVD